MSSTLTEVVELAPMSRPTSASPKILPGGSDLSNSKDAVVAEHNREIDRIKRAPTPPRSSLRESPLTPGGDLLDPPEAAITNAAATAPEPDYPTGAKYHAIVLSMSFVLILLGLDQSILATAVPTMTDHFHTVADVGWYSSAYRLMMCAFQFMFGKVYKIFSIKRVFLATVGVFLVGSLVCTMAPTSKVFVLGRAVTGLGAAGIMAGVYTLLVRLFPLRKRPVNVSLFSVVEDLAVVAASILGGVLTERLSWRWCFWISLPIGGLTMMITAIFLADEKENSAVTTELSWRQKLAQLDLLGNLFFVPSLTCLFIALGWAGLRYPWSDGRVITLLIFFGMLLTAFIYQQHRKQDAATIPPRIIKQRSIIAGFIFSCCCNSALNVLQYYMPTYFQTIRDYSPAKSGWMMLPLIIGMTIGGLICGAGTSIGDTILRPSSRHRF
jgi:MFS family permease